MRTSRTRIFLGLLALCASGCSSAEVGATDAELVGGAVPASLPPGVVALHVPCTAVKIGPREFLTAGHCVVRNRETVDRETLEPNGTFARGEQMCAYGAVDVRPESCTALTIVAAKVHPTYAAHLEKHSTSSASIEFNHSDLALVRVDRDSPGIPIAMLSKAAPTVGDAIVMAGYGCTAWDPQGRPLPSARQLRVGSSRIGALRERLLVTDVSSPVQACPGDSGGPVYAIDEQGKLSVVGINSFVQLDRSTGMARVDEGTEARAWVESLLGVRAPVDPGACPVLEGEVCRTVEARDVHTLSKGSFNLPGFGFSEGKSFFTFGAQAGERVVLSSTTDFRTFTAAPPLPWAASDVTGASTGGRNVLYFLGVDRTGTPALQMSKLRGSVVEPPTAVSLEGAAGVGLYWPQATGLADGRTLLAFVDAQQQRAFLAVDDGSGARFRAGPWPQVSGSPAGLLTHVGTTTSGSWVITHQAAVASGKTASFVQVSKNDGQQWSTPRNIQPTAASILDAFPVARQDEGADLYYLRDVGGDSAIHRRALHEDGTLGPEQVVTSPSVGSVEAPQPRRLPDGRLAMMMANRRSAESTDLALVILDGDAPR